MVHVVVLNFFWTLPLLLKQPKSLSSIPTYVLSIVKVPSNPFIFIALGFSRKGEKRDSWLFRDGRGRVKLVDDDYTNEN